MTLSSDPLHAFVTGQRRKFAEARRRPEATGLKRAGYDLLETPVELDEYGSNPELLVFPEAIAERVEGLPECERAGLTRAFYALSKEGTAQNEMITLDWNLRATAASYGTFSDAWFVEWGETEEEMDHILAFDAMARAILGRSLSVEEYARRDRFRRSFETIVRLLRCRHSAPALYFCVRYVANIQLRGLEELCMREDGSGRRYNRFMEEINREHFRDESRHYASSRRFAVDLLGRITVPYERELVRGIVSGYLLDLLHFTRSRSVLRGFSRAALELGLEQGTLPSMGLDRPAVAALYAQPYRTPARTPLWRELDRITCRRLHSLERALGLDEPGASRQGLSWIARGALTVVERRRAAATKAYASEGSAERDSVSDYAWFQDQLGETATERPCTAHPPPGS